MKILLSSLPSPPLPSPPVSSPPSLPSPLLPLPSPLLSSLLSLSLWISSYSNPVVEEISLFSLNCFGALSKSFDCMCIGFFLESILFLVLFSFVSVVMVLKQKWVKILRYTEVYELVQKSHNKHFHHLKTFFVCVQ